MLLRTPSTIAATSNDASQTKAMQRPASVSSIPEGLLQNQEAIGRSLVPNTLEEEQYSKAIPLPRLDRDSLNIEKLGNPDEQVEISPLTPLEFTMPVQVALESNQSGAEAQPVDVSQPPPNQIVSPPSVEPKVQEDQKERGLNSEESSDFDLPDLHESCHSGYRRLRE